MDGLISVIIPVYNVEAYLDKCVSSVVNQTYRNLEIILVDDGSMDRCGAMCDAWAEKDSRIRVIHKFNGGLSDARNAGLVSATGQYIGFVDSDDYIAPNMYEMLLQRMVETNSDISACGVEMVWEDGSDNQLLTPVGNFLLNNMEAMHAILVEDKLKQPVWYKLYKRNLIWKLLFPVGKYHEDVFWSYRAIANADRVAIVDTIGYYYVQRAGSIMADSFSIKRLDAVEGKQQRLKFIEENYPALTATAKHDFLFFCLYNGQKALQYLQGQEQIQVMESLKSNFLAHLMTKEEAGTLPPLHRIWLWLAEKNFAITCKLRNRLKIGV